MSSLQLNRRNLGSVKIPKVSPKEYYVGMLRRSLATIKEDPKK